MTNEDNSHPHNRTVIEGGGHCIVNGAGKCLAYVGQGESMDFSNGWPDEYHQGVKASKKLRPTKLLQSEATPCSNTAVPYVSTRGWCSTTSRVADKTHDELEQNNGESRRRRRSRYDVASSEFFHPRGGPMRFNTTTWKRPPNRSETLSKYRKYIESYDLSKRGIPTVAIERISNKVLDAYLKMTDYSEAAPERSELKEHCSVVSEDDDGPLNTDANLPAAKPSTIVDDAVSVCDSFRPPLDADDTRNVGFDDPKPKRDYCPDVADVTTSGGCSSGIADHHLAQNTPQVDNANATLISGCGRVVVSDESVEPVSSNDKTATDAPCRNPHRELVDLCAEPTTKMRDQDNPQPPQSTDGVLKRSAVGRQSVDIGPFEIEYTVVSKGDTLLQKGLSVTLAKKDTQMAFNNADVCFESNKVLATTPLKQLSRGKPDVFFESRKKPKTNPKIIALAAVDSRGLQDSLLASKRNSTMEQQRTLADFPSSRPLSSLKNDLASSNNPSYSAAEAIPPVQRKPTREEHRRRLTMAEHEVVILPSPAHNDRHTSSIASVCHSDGNWNCDSQRIDTRPTVSGSSDNGTDYGGSARCHYHQQETVPTSENRTVRVSSRDSVDSPTTESHADFANGDQQGQHSSENSDDHQNLIATLIRLPDEAILNMWSVGRGFDLAESILNREAENREQLEDVGTVNSNKDLMQTSGRPDRENAMLTPVGADVYSDLEAVSTSPLVLFDYTTIDEELSEIPKLTPEDFT